MVLSAGLALALAVSILAALPSLAGACKDEDRQEKSNLADEFDPIAAALPSQQGRGRIKALIIYPVKSCRGIELQTANVVDTGLEWDRVFCFAEWKDSAGEWKFVTQRQYPLLACVQTRIVSGTAGSSGSSGSGGRGKLLQVSFPGKWWGSHRFVVPLELAAHTAGGGEAGGAGAGTEAETETGGGVKCKVRVWKDGPEALKLPVDLRALQGFLGLPGGGKDGEQRLAMFRCTQKREVFRCAPRREQLGWQPVVGFADSVCSPLSTTRNTADERSIHCTW